MAEDVWDKAKRLAKKERIAANKSFSLEELILDASKKYQETAVDTVPKKGSMLHLNEQLRMNKLKNQRMDTLRGEMTDFGKKWWEPGQASQFTKDVLEHNKSLRSGKSLFKGVVKGAFKFLGPIGIIYDILDQEAVATPDLPPELIKEREKSRGGISRNPSVLGVE